MTNYNVKKLQFENNGDTYEIKTDPAISAEPNNAIETKVDGLFVEKSSQALTFDDIYPIGSVYISVGDIKPVFGQWERLATGTTLWNDTTPDGRTISAGLPNITGTININGDRTPIQSTGGAFQATGPAGVTFPTPSSTANTTGQSISFNASRSSSIYGASNSVQPPAIAVSMWRRVN